MRELSRRDRLLRLVCQELATCHMPQAECSQLEKSLEKGDPEACFSVLRYALYGRFSDKLHDWLAQTGFTFPQSSDVGFVELNALFSDNLQFPSRLTPELWLHRSSDLSLISLKLAQLFIFLKLTKRRHNAIHMALEAQEIGALSHTDIVSDLRSLGTPDCYLVPRDDSTPQPSRISEYAGRLRQFCAQQKAARSIDEYAMEVGLEELALAQQVHVGSTPSQQQDILSLDAQFFLDSSKRTNFGVTLQ